MTRERFIYLLEQKINQALTEKEWHELENWYREQQDKPDIFDGRDILRENDYRAELFQRISGELECRAPLSNNKRQVITMKHWKIAAAVLIFGALTALTGRWIFVRKPPFEQVASLQHQPTSSDQPADWKIINTTAYDSSYFLEDKSKVVLSPNSEIAFRRPFRNEMREIRLTGSARFYVQKNPQKPFIVYSKNIYTTALGTSFTVSEHSKDSSVKVSLHEGKVVVKSNETDPGRQMTPVYLKPGESLSVNTQTLLAVFSKSRLNNSDQREEAKQKMTHGQLGKDLVFEQQPLDEVLKTVSLHYGTVIKFDKSVIKGLEFSGTIKRGSDLDAVLKRMAILNELSVQKRHSSYIITKN